MKKTNLFLIATLFSTNLLAVDLETEPNNEIKDASPITPGVMFQGQISNGQDVDWFFFETSDSDVLTFTTPLPDVIYHGKTITVHDADKNVLYTKTLEFDDTLSDENLTSERIGLKQAGKFFISVMNTAGAFDPFDYELTANLENQPPFTATTTCPTYPKFSGATGILEIPAVDVEDAFGGSTTYKANMKLIPSLTGSLTFEVTEASAE